MATKSVDVRFEPNEKPPVLLSLGISLQFAILIIAGIVLTPAIVVRAAGAADSYLLWAVFAAVLVSGITTVVQAARFGRIGSGYVLLMGTSGAFISVCVAAIAQSGPATLATLLVISSLFQFVLAARLSAFRRVLTPIVTGVVIMLIPVTVMPIVFNMLTDVPEATSPLAAPISAALTIIVICCIALTAKGNFRLWAPVIGIAIGTGVGSFFGIYDHVAVAAASWAGLPPITWPGFDLDFGPNFWVLLLPFIFVTLVGAVETIGDSVAIQQVSWRKPRAIDFRSVQGAVGADGLGNLLSGIFGTVPNTTYSTSIAAVDLTGVAARRIGVFVGLIFVVVAFLPKLVAVVLAIPNPVVAAYVTVLLSALFVTGMKLVVDEATDYRKGLIAGIAFWIGVGCQNNLIFPEIIGDFGGGILKNGMTSGGLTAIILSLFLELTQVRKKKLEVAFKLSNLPKVNEFLAKFANHNGWNQAMLSRLESASEECMLTLIDRKVSDDIDERKLVLIARQDSGGAQLDFIVGPSSENIHDQIKLLEEKGELTTLDREISMRLLHHYASSIRHQQYYDLDIVTLNVDVPITAVHPKKK